MAGRLPTDTAGWVDLSGYLVSGASGTVRGRIRMGWVQIKSSIVTWAVPSQATDTLILTGLPAMWRPDSDVLGQARRSGYSGDSVATSSGTLSVSNRTGVTWNAVAFTVTFPAEA